MTRRGRGTLRIIAFFLLAGSVTALALTRRSDDAAAAVDARPAPPLRTPLFSARRLPILFVDDVAQVHLRNNLVAAIAPFDGCVAVDDAKGPVARVGNDRTFAPASTLKLVTAVTALTTLGPNARLTTRALMTGDGTLVVVGGGDPLLATPEWIADEHAQARFRDAPYTELDALAAAIASSGVRNVRAIVVDDRRHDSLRFLPAWKPSYATEGEIGALGALTVDGGFADPVRQTPAPDPAILTGQRLAALLTQHGVTVSGGVAHGAAPGDAVEIAHVDSAPLSAVVGEMLTSSDNYTAEQLLREAAVGTAHGQPATTEMGVATAIDTLTRLRIPHPGIDIHDGSGLAPSDRVACPTLLAVIDVARRPKYASIAQGLPVAGQTGTLALRFGGDPLAGALHAKTGSLDGVVGLAGTIDAHDHPRFAFIANGSFSEAAGAALQQNVAHIVAGYPEPVDTKALVPAP